MQDGAIKLLRGIASAAGGFIVDGFNFVRPECKHYFLSHFHSDHTTGLHASFDVGTVYCSPVTAELIMACIGVRRKVVHPIELGRTETIAGVEVTLLNASHCPGSVIFHFFDPQSGQAVINTRFPRRC